MGVEWGSAVGRECGSIVFGLVEVELGLGVGWLGRRAANRNF